MTDNETSKPGEDLPEYSDDAGDHRPASLEEPGSQGQPGSLDDGNENLPGSQKDPIMEDSKIDPEAPISSAKGTA